MKFFLINYVNLILKEKTKQSKVEYQTKFSCIGAWLRCIYQSPYTNMGK